jgi:hypothetical protein
VAKDANPLPAGARRLNPVFHEWSRRIGEPAAALRELNRALADGRLVAWIPSRGVLPPSYWQTAQVAFDSVDPLCVIVRGGKREVRASFYTAEAALPAAGGAVVAKSAKEWLEEAWKLWPKKPYEKTTSYAGRIHRKMEAEADKVDNVMDRGTIRICYNEHHQKSLRAIHRLIQNEPGDN